MIISDVTMHINTIMEDLMNKLVNKNRYKYALILLAILLLSINTSTILAKNEVVEKPNYIVRENEYFSINKRVVNINMFPAKIWYTGHKNNNRYVGYLWIKKNSIRKIDGLYEATYSGFLPMENNYLE